MLNADLSRTFRDQSVNMKGRTSSLRAVVSLQLLLLFCSAVCQVQSFILPSSECSSQIQRQRLQSPLISTSTELHARGVNFAGDSTSTVFVPHPPVPSTGEPNPSRTLPDYLRSSHSDSLLLGTSNFKQRPDGLWEAFQPEIDWFGLQLVPVFVNKIDRPEETEDVVYVDIMEARTDIAGGRSPGNRAKAIAQIMERSSFSGRYEILFENASGRRGAGWSLSGDLTLVLSVPLPKLVPLPPGFNTIGSRIVRTTCRTRVEAQLQELREGYIEWAEQDGDP